MLVLDLLNIFGVLPAADPLPPDLAASLLLCEIAALFVVDLLLRHDASFRICQALARLLWMSAGADPRNSFASCTRLNDDDSDSCPSICGIQVLIRILVEIV